MDLPLDIVVLSPDENLPFEFKEVDDVKHGIIKKHSRFNSILLIVVYS